ncbi:MAG: hypothetical protein M0Z73_10935 [Betaproteobacteria bacterium]|nr:hypothetical protein [Betaproteobacteria bacterium]
MNASPAPAAPPRTREPTDEPLAAETLAAHARRALRTGVRARVTAVLDAGIAFLERLREKAGGAREKTEDIDGRRRPARRGASAAAGETPGDVPRPKRRLRALLIHLGVLLAGGIGGGALAYTLFQQQLDRVLAESLRREAARAKQAQPGADIRQAFEDARTQRDDAERKLAASLATYSASTSGSYTRLESLFGAQLVENRRLEAALAEQTRSGAEARRALEAEAAKRRDAEAKLAQSESALSDKQEQIDTAKKQLAALNGVDASRAAAQETPARRRESRPPKSGNCTLDAGNVAALKGCIESFNQ